MESSNVFLFFNHCSSFITDGVGGTDRLRTGRRSVSVSSSSTVVSISKLKHCERGALRHQKQPWTLRGWRKTGRSSAITLAVTFPHAHANVSITSIWLPLLLLLLLLFFGLLNEGLKKQWKKQRLPPGPRGLPIIGNIHQLGRSVTNFGSLLSKLHLQYGPIFLLRFGSRPTIFVAEHELAHQALVQRSATFAGRPATPALFTILNRNSPQISTLDDGCLWRLLRRNLASDVLSRTGIKSFSEGRRWALKLLVSSLKDEAAGSGGVVTPIKSFRRAVFCQLLFMCFGKILEDDVVLKIETALRDLVLRYGLLNLLSTFPRITKILFPRPWHELLELRRKREEAILPLIRDCKAAGRKPTISYVDSLLSLELPDGRKLEDDEILVLCVEFLNGGNDTTSTTLQWTMANLVKNPEIQKKLHDEVSSVVGERAEVSEDDLMRMPYLRAVVMETLRRHPPTHLLLNHTVTEEGVTLGGHAVPQKGLINFMVGEMGLDEKVWKEPLEFRPARFLPGGEGEEVDITGSKEIKMIPFGAGRRICPGIGVAMLHLQYLVANLVHEFEWSALPGDTGEVDLTENWEFTVVMKTPLKALIKPRQDQTRR